MHDAQLSGSSVPCSRYERPASGHRLAGGALVQRHIASEEDLAYAAGKGVLVPLDRDADPVVLGQVEPEGAKFL